MFSGRNLTSSPDGGRGERGLLACGIQESSQGALRLCWCVSSNLMFAVPTYFRFRKLFGPISGPRANPNPTLNPQTTPSHPQTINTPQTYPTNPPQNPPPQPTHRRGPPPQRTPRSCSSSPSSSGPNCSSRGIRRRVFGGGGGGLFVLFLPPQRAHIFVRSERGSNRNTSLCPAVFDMWMVAKSRDRTTKGSHGGNHDVGWYLRGNRIIPGFRFCGHLQRKTQ